MAKQSPAHPAPSPRAADDPVAQPPLVTGSTDSMVERVAAAIRVVASRLYGRDGGLVYGLRFSLARAAISAMREPTEAMMIVGDRAHKDATRQVCRATLPGTTWRAMIDAALEDK